MHGGARGNYRQFFRIVFKPFLGDFIPGHLIFARRCKGQLPPICSGCLGATPWRLPSRVISFLHGGVRGSYRQFLFGLFPGNPGASYVCTAMHRVATAKFCYGLSWCHSWRLPYRVIPFLHGGLRGSYRQFVFGLSWGNAGASYFCTAVQGAATANFFRGCLGVNLGDYHLGSSHFCMAV